MTIKIEQIKFPARLSTHFVMNIIMAKTGSTAKVNSAEWHISNPPKYIPAKISSHAIYTYILTMLQGKLWAP